MPDYHDNDMAPPTVTPEEKRPEYRKSGDGDTADPKGEATSSVDSGPFQETKKLSGWKLALVMTSLCLAVFCMALVGFCGSYVSQSQRH
jgi:hypothetical protein